MSAPSFIKDPSPSSKQSLNPPITPSPIQCFIAEIDRKLGKIEGQLSQVYHVRDRPIRTEDSDPRISWRTAHGRQPEWNAARGLQFQECGILHGVESYLQHGDLLFF